MFEYFNSLNPQNFLVIKNKIAMQIFKHATKTLLIKN